MRACIFSVFSGLRSAAWPWRRRPAAQPYGPPPPYGDRDGVQPLDRLLPGIRREHPGDFYDAEGPTYGPAGDPHYHLKWMTPDGRVIWYDTDARSGRVLRSSPGRDSFDESSPRRSAAAGYGRPLCRAMRVRYDAAAMAAIAVMRPGGYGGSYGGRAVLAAAAMAAAVGDGGGRGAAAAAAAAGRH